MDQRELLQDYGRKHLGEDDEQNEDDNSANQTNNVNPENSGCQPSVNYSQRTQTHVTQQREDIDDMSRFQRENNEFSENFDNNVNDGKPKRVLVYTNEKCLDCWPKAFLPVLMASSNQRQNKDTNCFSSSF